MDHSTRYSAVRPFLYRINYFLLFWLVNVGIGLAAEKFIGPAARASISFSGGMAIWYFADGSVIFGYIPGGIQKSENMFLVVINVVAVWAAPAADASDFRKTPSFREQAWDKQLGLVGLYSVCGRRVLRGQYSLQRAGTERCWILFSVRTSYSPRFCGTGYSDDIICATGIPAGYQLPPLPAVMTYKTAY